MEQSVLQRIPPWFATELSALSITTASWFGSYRNEPKYRTRGAALDYWLLQIVHAGGQRLVIRDRAVVIESGQGVIIPPGHRFVEDTRVPTWYTQFPVVFHGPVTYERNPILHLDFPCSMPVLEPTVVEELATEVFQMTRNPMSILPWERLRGNVIVQALLCQLLAGGFASGVLSSAQPEKREWIRAARSYLRRHYKNPDLTIAEMAESVGKSVAEVQRVFAATYEYPPKEWLHRYRLSIASQLMLNNPHFTLEAVMKRCGYRNRSLMHRLFKRYLGCTPGEMRRQAFSGNKENVDATIPEPP